MLIKDRLKSLGKTQVWLVLELQKGGIVVQPQHLCSIINGVSTYPKAKHILQVCDEIIEEAESNARDST